jgi:hypothetical protein
MKCDDPVHSIDLIGLNTQNLTPCASASIETGPVSNLCPKRRRFRDVSIFEWKARFGAVGCQTPTAFTATFPRRWQTSAP